MNPRNILHIALFAIFLCLPGVSIAGPVKKAELAWIQENNGNYDIQYSYYDGKNWLGNIALSSGNPVNFVPAMAKRKNGDTWLVWSTDTSAEYHLYFAIISGDKVLRGPEQIQTGLNHNATPSLLIDTNDTPWIAWSGSNGGKNDIYYTRFTGNSWEQKRNIPDADNRLDLVPILSQKEDGIIALKWRRYGDLGVKLTSALIAEDTTLILDSQSQAARKKGQQNQIRISAKERQQKFEKQLDNCVSEFPQNIADLNLATLHMNCEEKGTTVQFVGKKIKTVKK